MRILFTFTGGRGHLDPLIAIARAAAAAGHTVAFSGQARLMPAVEAEGFAAFATFPSSGDGAPVRTSLLELSAEREDAVLRDVFAGRLARQRADGLLALCGTWQPDLLVCDEVDFGALVAAERLGLPYATVLVTAAGSFVRADVVAEPLDALRAEHGLDPDPELAMLRRHLVLSPFPPSFRDPSAPLPVTARSVRMIPCEPARAGRTPLVYFTLGTVFNLESGDLFARVLAGLRELPIELVVSVGDPIDPSELGPQPPNVRVERHVDHASLLPRCSAVVSHGGSGTVLAALAHGLPSVLLPMGADQPLNAQRCASLGVARVLDAVRATPADAGAAVAAVLTDPRYRDAALRMRDELVRLPGPEHAVDLLRALALRYPRRVGSSDASPRGWTVRST
ncbi:MAG TPA: glycosyltransferase [Solirubrobacteraceae bacterium]|nr:glycosyltransferase [Solirubrobacteraceae bacterium]